MSEKDTVVVVAAPPGKEPPKESPPREVVRREMVPLEPIQREAVPREVAPPESPETRITEGMDERTQVEHTADRIRDELLLTLEELDRRRARAMDVRYQLSSHRDLLMMAGGAALMLAGVGLGVSIWRARHRQELLAKKRRKAFERAWQNPDRVASSAEQRPLSVELGRKLVLIFGTALATSIAKNSVATLVPQRSLAEQKAIVRQQRREEAREALRH